MVEIIAQKENQADELIHQGIELAESGNHAAAHKYFQQAYALHPTGAKVNAWLGYTTAIVENKVGTGMQMCKKAVESGIPDAYFYRNIGKLHLMQKNKRAALGAFATGLVFDKGNKAILKEWKTLGFRRKPFLPFLSRENGLNKFLGKLTWKYAKNKEKK
jgi:Flp pilus assembly protein TadD